MTKTNQYLFHNDCLSHFNQSLFAGVFARGNIKSSKKAIVLEIDGNKGEKVGKSKHYGYYLEKDNKRYFLPDSELADGTEVDSTDKMPIKILSSKEVDYKGDVFQFIESMQSVTIPSVQKLPFSKVVDTFCNFEHTNHDHWLLWKLVALTAYIDRINFRVVSETGFGKDSCIDGVKNLVNSTSNIYGATFAKMEFHLKNKFLLFNEMGNLKPEDRFNFQQFFLATGAYSNNYSKRSRKTESTLEDYDITTTSIGIAYNLPQYYISQGQEYFETLFTSAVVNRFLPFLFEGRLTTDFSVMINPEEIVTENLDLYKDMISTLNYYKMNPVRELKYELPLEICFTDKQKRYERTFNTICKYIAEYSLDEKEFQYISSDLFKCYRNYIDLHTKGDKENE